LYNVAREELDRELLNDVPLENKDLDSKEVATLTGSGVIRKHPALAVMIAVFLPVLVLMLYFDLGMYIASDNAFVFAQQQTAEQPSVKQPSVEQMTAQLQLKIEKDGGTVTDWIMLGRAHKHLGDNEQAANAFAVALEKDTSNAQLMLERAEVLALSNNREFTEEATALVLNAFALEPNNPNTLWFVGVAEYQAENYQQAITHLIRLLPLMGDDEEVIKSVIGVIAKSRQALIAAGREMPELVELLAIEVARTEAVIDSAEDDITVNAPAFSLSVAVDVSAQVRQAFTADDVVFVYAKAKQGPRMPLAVQRLTLGSLPATVVLDESMAMVAGMSISAFDQLIVSARVTKTGSAIAQSGDYIGQVGVENKSEKVSLKIVIDTLVP
ncbi:MAG: hypothetical protein JKX75_07235, partial [Gammaproteobacteria bacterium]|nr:hypothetical protein [Gammaproteobacteria bacterium]